MSGQLRFPTGRLASYRFIEGEGVSDVDISIGSVCRVENDILVSVLSEHCPIVNLTAITSKSSGYVVRRQLAPIDLDLDPKLLPVSMLARHGYERPRLTFPSTHSTKHSPAADLVAVGGILRILYSSAQAISN